MNNLVNNIVTASNDYIFFSKKNISSLINAMDDLLIQLDEFGNVVFIHAPHCCSDAFELSKPKKLKIKDLMSAEIEKNIMDGFAINKNNKTAEYEYQQKIGNDIKWFSAKSTPLFNKNKFEGCLVISRDITNKKVIEEMLKKIIRELKMINSCNQALFKIKKEQELLDLICKLIVTEGEYRMAWIGLNNNGLSIQPAAKYGEVGNFLNKTFVKWGDEICGVNLSAGNYIVCQNIETDEKVAVWKAEALKNGYRSFVVLPLEYGEKVGTLIIYSDEINFFKKEEVKILVELSNDLSYGIISLRNQQKKEKTEQDLFMRTQELERINNLMIGRELKMIDLKQEINDLKNKININ